MKVFYRAAFWSLLLFGVSALHAQFKDLPENHWSYKYVTQLVVSGGITGYDTDGDGVGDEFRPSGKITRAEFLAVLVRSVRLPKPVKVAQAPFPDVSEKHWAAPFAALSKELGVIPSQMVPAGKFEPNKAITRAEMAAVLANFLPQGALTGQVKFKDVKGDFWASEGILRVAEAGVVTGYEDGTFKPAKDVTRAEASTMLVRLTTDQDLARMKEVFAKAIEAAEKVSGGEVAGRYTGLIIVCKGKGLVRSRAPLVYAEDESVVYGEVKEWREDLHGEKGLAGYYATEEEAMRSRVGAHPLIVECSRARRKPGVEGGDPDVPVVSDSDKEKILQANQSDQFLERLDVAIVL